MTYTCGKINIVYMHDARGTQTQNPSSYIRNFGNLDQRKKIIKNIHFGAEIVPECRIWSGCLI